MRLASNELKAAIERCYTAFAGVPAPTKLIASPLRDADEILRTLTAAPLRQLTGEQIGPYSGWALTTVGGERDYRHFLPRILELSVTDPVWLGAEPPIIASHMNMAEWRKWPNAQRQAALEFFERAFEAVADTHPDEFLDSADQWFCGLVTLGEDPAKYMKAWVGRANDHAALQLARFIGDEAKRMAKHGDVKGPFWEDIDEGTRREVCALLRSAPVREFLTSAAERVSAEERVIYIDAALSGLDREYW